MQHTETVPGKVTMDNDIVEVTIGDIVWRIRLTLDGATVTLRDAATGVLLHENPLECLGITSQNGRYRPGKRDRETILSAFVIAWILMKERH